MFELRVPSVGLGVEWNDTVWWGVGVGGVCVFLFFVGCFLRSQSHCALKWITLNSNADLPLETSVDGNKIEY